MAVLAFPFGANLDTGNINLQLTLMLWAAQFTGPRLGGLLWALATWMKWVPVVFLPILPGRAKLWGLVWLSVSIGLSVLTLPLTIIQFQALFGFRARPVRLDYVVYLWATVPWLYRRPDPFDFLRPVTWRGWLATARLRFAGPSRSPPPGGASRPPRPLSSRRRSSTGRSRSAPIPIRTTASHSAARGPDPSSPGPPMTSMSVPPTAIASTPAEAVATFERPMSTGPTTPSG